MSKNEFALEEHYTNVNGVQLHYVRAGSGPLMVFLHGFPQGWFIFRPQLEEFARDHTVVAMDLRGFGRSEKPERLSEYGSWVLADDTKALVEQLGFDRFTLVGHDIGGGVGYSFALHYPEMLERLVPLCAAHPALFDRELHENPAQMEASQYLLALRHPSTPAALAASDFAQLREGVFAEHEFFTEEKIALHLDGWRQPRGAEGLCGWHRREGLGPREAGTPARGNYVPEVCSLEIETPSLVIYAERDKHILPGCFAGLEEYMPNLTLRTVPGASHWLLDEHPQLINQLVRKFIEASTPAVAGGDLATA